MTTPAAPGPMPILPLGRILTAVSDQTRWRILAEFLKDESLPVIEIRRRLKIPASNASKHLKTLLDIGILQRGFGDHYRLPAHWRIPGQRALDFGAVVIRLDRLDGA